MKKISQENIIKISILAFLIIFFLALAVVLNINQNNNDKKNSENEVKFFKTIDDYQLFFFASKNINNFITSTSDINKVYNLLFEDFKNNNDITLNNLNSFVKSYEENAFFTARNIKSYLINDNLLVFYITGDIYQDNEDYLKLLEKNATYILFIDYVNESMAITPINNEFDEEKFISNLNDNLFIKKNEYNQFERINLVNNNTMCLTYLNDFLNKIYFDIEEAYKLTNNFGSLVKFKKFIEENELSTILSSCNIHLNDANKRVYTIVDNNNIIYKFTEESVMNYKVSLTK